MALGCREIPLKVPRVSVEELLEPYRPWRLWPPGGAVVCLNGGGPRRVEDLVPRIHICSHFAMLTGTDLAIRRLLTQWTGRILPVLRRRLSDGLSEPQARRLGRSNIQVSFVQPCPRSVWRTVRFRSWVRFL